MAASLLRLSRSRQSDKPLRASSCKRPQFARRSQTPTASSFKPTASNAWASVISRRGESHSSEAMTAYSAARTGAPFASANCEALASQRPCSIGDGSPESASQWASTFSRFMALSVMDAKQTNTERPKEVEAPAMDRHLPQLPESWLLEKDIPTIRAVKGAARELCQEKENKEQIVRKAAARKAAPAYSEWGLLLEREKRNAMNRRIPTMPNSDANWSGSQWDSRAQTILRRMACSFLAGRRALRRSMYSYAKDPAPAQKN